MSTKKLILRTSYQANRFAFPYAFRPSGSAKQTYMPYHLSFFNQYISLFEPKPFRLRNGMFFLLAMLFLYMGFTPYFLSDAYAAPTVVQRYASAKQKMEQLRTDPKRCNLREPWQNLADTFLLLYEKNPRWNNRTAALFRSALALDEIARRSMLRQDAVRAVERYERLFEQHPKNVLADDALYNAARLKAERLNDAPGARQLLQRLLKGFPKGDRAAVAKTYLARLEPPAATENRPQTPSTSSEIPTNLGTGEGESALLTQVAWQTKRDTVRITFDFDRPVAWSVHSYKADKKNGSPIRLVVDLDDTIPDRKIRPGVKVAQSPLRALRLDLSRPGQCRFLLDFSALKRFSVTTESSPFQLVITAVLRDALLPKGLTLGRSIASDPIQDTAGDTLLPSNLALARQLGLTVSTVLLDPGHGGKDPGTSHNGIVEREVTLDLARRVGALLTARGLTVHYTRTNDSWVSLDARTHMAHELKADLMVSIHVNASPKTITSGFETYYLNFASTSDAVRLAGVENAMSERKLGELEGLLADLMLGARTQESQRMAETLQQTTIAYLRKKKYGTEDGGTKSAPFHVLLGSGMPGVLIEVGYCTNANEAKLLATSAYRKALAEGIAAGILAYAGKLDANHGSRQPETRKSLSGQ